jgi:hypothetical protein
MKKEIRPYAPKRGAKFVLGMGTRNHGDEKKRRSKEGCRNLRALRNEE